MAVLIPENIIADRHITSEPPPISQLANMAQESLNQLQSESKNKDAFHGLYVIGSASQRTTTNTHEDYLGLEWQLFRRGYFEGQKKSELSTSQTLLDGYRLRRNLRQQALDQSMYQINLMQNTIRAYYYHRLFTEQSHITDIYRRRMHAGFTTRVSLSQEESQLQTIQDKRRLYDSLPHGPITSTTAELLNHIESLVLMPIENLQQQAIKNSGLEEIQQLIQRQASLSIPSWRDNLRVGVYARRYHDYIGSQGNEIGIQFDIPVDGNTNHKAVTQHQMHLLALQYAANKTRLQEQLLSLKQQFHYAQDTVRQLKNDYAQLMTESSLNCKQLQHVVPMLNDTPEKSLEKMSVKILSTQRDILIARLEAYRLLLQLQAKVQPLPGVDWYSIQ